MRWPRCFQRGNPEPRPPRTVTQSPGVPFPTLAVAGGTAVPAAPSTPRTRLPHSPDTPIPSPPPTRTPRPHGPSSFGPTAGPACATCPCSHPVPRGPSRSGGVRACPHHPRPRTTTEHTTLPTRLHRTHDNPTVTNHDDSLAMGRAHAAGQGRGGSRAGAGQGDTFVLLLGGSPARRGGRPGSVTPEGARGPPRGRSPFSKCPIAARHAGVLLDLCLEIRCLEEPGPFPFSHSWGAEAPVSSRAATAALLPRGPSHPRAELGVGD